MSKQALKRVRRSIGLEVNRDKLPAYTSVGGYPLLYICADGGALCPECANAEITQIDEARKERYSSGWKVVGADVYYEGSVCYCDNCNRGIESAYGNPWEGEETE